jgi:gliding motility-associated-like protein
VNSGTYQPGTGEVTFNSTSRTIPQIIHHNGQVFNKLTVSGGTKKIVLSDIVVETEIHLQSGVVETSGSSRVIFNNGVNVSGASDSSHIHGIVYQQGSGSKLFPIGNGLVYLPVELLNVEDASSVIGVQAFEYDNINLTKPASLRSISEKRYWHLDVVSGVMKNSQVVLPVRDDSWDVDPKNIVVVQSASPTETFTSIGRSFFEGETDNGRVVSDQHVTMPFIALATAEPGLKVYNAVSANDDGLNDFLMIENIENFPENKLSVFNRWGDKVFEIRDYDNAARAFKGWSNVQGEKELVNGTYFYVLELPQGETLRGFLAVKN